MASAQACDVDARLSMRDLVPVTLIAFFGYVAVALPLPALAIHLQDGLGLGPVWIGWMIAAQSITTVLSRNRSGRIVDALGPKRGALLGLPSAALAGSIYGLSILVPGPAVAIGLILAARILLGFAESFFLTSTITWGIGRVGAAHTGAVIAWQGIALYLALGLGAPLGLWLQHQFGFAAVGAAAAASPLVGVVLALALSPAPIMRRDPTPFHRVFALVWRPGFVTTLSTVAFGAVGSFLSLFYVERGWTGAGFAFTGLAGGFVLVRLVCPDLATRFGGWRVSAASLAIEGAGQIVLWIAPSAFVAAVGTTLTGVGYSLIFPAMGVEAVRGVDPSRRGQVVANFSAFSDIAIGGTGPLLGAAIMQFGYQAPFAAGTLACLAGLLFIALRRREG